MYLIVSTLSLRVTRIFYSGLRTMHHFIHSVLVVMFLNSFVLFVAACMKTIPTEAASISAQLDNVPLRRMPVLNAQDDYSSHIQQFRQAKTFPSPQPTEPLATVDSAAASAASASTTDKTVDPPRISNREPSHAKTFAVKTDTRSEKSKIEEKTSRDEGSNNVHNDRDLFEALQVEKPGKIFSTCIPENLRFRQIYLVYVRKQANLAQVDRISCQTTFSYLANLL